MKNIGDVIQGMQEPDRSPSKRQRHDALVNAIIRGVTGKAYDPDNPPKWSETVWGKLHRLAKWYSGDEENAEFPAPANATPENIVSFHDWYRRTYPTISFPEAREKVLNHWANWEMSQHTGRRNASMVAETGGELGEELRRFDSPDYRPLTAEEKADWLEAHRPRFGGTNE